MPTIIPVSSTQEEEVRYEDWRVDMNADFRTINSVIVGSAMTPREYFHTQQDVTKSHLSLQALTLDQHWVIHTTTASD